MVTETIGVIILFFSSWMDNWLLDP